MPSYPKMIVRQLSNTSLLFLVIILAPGCGAQRKLESQREILTNSANELSHGLASAVGLQVAFRAQYGNISSRLNEPELRAYRNTHFSVSLHTERQEQVTAAVLVPAYDQILPSLRPGDQVLVEGTPHLTSDGRVFVLVTKLSRL